MIHIIGSFKHYRQGIIVCPYEGFILYTDKYKLPYLSLMSIRVQSKTV